MVLNSEKLVSESSNYWNQLYKNILIKTETNIKNHSLTIKIKEPAFKLKPHISSILT